MDRQMRLASVLTSSTFTRTMSPTLHRVLDLRDAGQGALGDVHQAVQAGLQLHEGAEGGDAHDLALHDGADGILLSRPRSTDGDWVCL